MGPIDNITGDTIFKMVSRWSWCSVLSVDENMHLTSLRMIVLLAFRLLCCWCLQFGMAADTIFPSVSIRYPESIISNGSKFQMGFFSPIASTDIFVGIWYYGIGPANGIVWVANRENPLNDSSGTVMIAEDGNVVVLNGQEGVVWSSNAQNLKGKNTAAQLLDCGNLVLVEKFTGMKHWESFSQPTNVGLPTMGIGVNWRTGDKVQLTSWKSPSDPSAGNFSAGIDPSNVPQFFLWNNSKPYYRSGPWNSRIFIGVPDMHSFYLDGFNLVDNKEAGTLYLTFAFANQSSFIDFSLDSQGKLLERIWRSSQKHWEIKRSVPETDCDVYGKCGPFGSCDPSQTPKICSCLPGFEPKNPEEWNRGNWTGGCARRALLQCQTANGISQVWKEDGFWMMEKMKVPDFVERSLIPEDGCRSSCLSSCSCIAYAYDAGIGCMSWNGTLIDMQKFSDGGVDLYIRLASSEFDRKPTLKFKIGATIAGIVGSLMISLSTFFFWKLIANYRESKRRRSKEFQLSNRRRPSSKFSCELLEDSHQELFHFKELVTATNNFDARNQLGRGGYGTVYKGTLQNGQEIAVKRLSMTSGQGSEEFTNEVVAISSVQHRNLVRLLGCCVEREEKILVYEYMPNKSLDALLFDPQEKQLLDWRRRCSIIEGISRGLLYLHRDANQRIIHRDLKAGNILLDDKMNPRISDFGMAKIFGGDEDQGSTKRVVGTCGYMSPEYVMEGLFSDKSDVYSFGILLLEIVSGRKNTRTYDDMHSLSLVGYAWKLWNEDKIVEFIDDKVVLDPCHYQEAIRCIHVGLLCVQEFAENRPSMSKVVPMINGEILDLPSPKKPAFAHKQIKLEVEASSLAEYSFFSNDMTITSLHGR